MLKSRARKVRLLMPEVRKRGRPKSTDPRPMHGHKTNSRYSWCGPIVSSKHKVTTDLAKVTCEKCIAQYKEWYPDAIFPSL